MRREGALVAFTLLLEWGTGLFLLARIAGLADGSAGKAASMAAGLLTLTALVCSLGHLGRPLRAWRALRRVPGSPLSREVAATLLFQLTWVAWALLTTLRPGGAASEALGWTAAIAALLAAWSVGPVYVATSLRAWRHEGTVATHLATALGLGSSSLSAVISVVGAPLKSVSFTSGVATAAALVCLLLASAHLLHLRADRPARERLGMRLPRGWQALFVLRVALLAAAAVGSAMLLQRSHHPAFAVACAAAFALAELCGRVLFYATARPRLP
jgi:anaerobic dimethyl sulfoxide reductase subunit C (anchor subunit)